MAAGTLSGDAALLWEAGEAWATFAWWEVNAETDFPAAPCIGLTLVPLSNLHPQLLGFWSGMGEGQ